MRILIATTNANKIREIVPLLRGLDLDLLTLADLPPIAEPHESGATFWENARIKALAYAAGSGLTTVAEDSGIEIAPLGGAPGIHSARFLGAGTPYGERFREIYRRLDAMPTRSRGARFITALAVARDSDILFETEAIVEGAVAPAPAGTDGFGYDPIFLYPPLGTTIAEWSPEGKAAVSHRARAFRDLARWFRSSRR